jgi:hypothetical protein
MALEGPGRESARVVFGARLAVESGIGFCRGLGRLIERGRCSGAQANEGNRI